MSTFDQRLREAYDYGVATAHATPACRDYLFEQWRERLAGLDPLDAIPTPPAGFEVTEEGTVVDRRPEPASVADLVAIGVMRAYPDPSRSWIP